MLSDKSDEESFVSLAASKALQNIADRLEDHEKRILELESFILSGESWNLRELEMRVARLETKVDSYE